jgi:hypothetical protein
MPITSFAIKSQHKPGNQVFLALPGISSTGQEIPGNYVQPKKTGKRFPRDLSGMMIARDKWYLSQKFKCGSYENSWHSKNICVSLCITMMLN